MTVLVLTRADDHYVPELVTVALAELGERDVVRVNTDLFPDDLALEDRGGDVTFVVDGRRIAGNDVRAVWRRRPWPGGRVASDPRYAQAAAWQARAAFDAAVSALPHVVNDPAKEREADHKGRQLGLANRLGFAVPETLISNAPDAVRAFVHDVRGRGHRVVTKLLVPLSSTMNGAGAFVYTTTLSDDDVLALNDVRWAPQIFQRRIDKTHDVRVQIMGDAIVAGAVACSSDDWRISSSGYFTRWTLPSRIEAACLAFARAQGLVTSAIDLVVDQDGQHWFLENNPAGEWGMLERDLGLGLHHALARCLVAGAR